MIWLSLQLAGIACAVVAAIYGISYLITALALRPKK